MRRKCTLARRFAARLNRYRAIAASPNEPDSFVAASRQVRYLGKKLPWYPEPLGAGFRLLSGANYHPDEASSNKLAYY